MHITDHHSPAAADGAPSHPAAGHEPPLFDGILRRLSRLLVDVEAYRRDRRAAADLTTLDDHLLADIGLNRADLPLGERRAPDPGPR